MAVSWVASTNYYSIAPTLKCFKDKLGIHAS